MQTALARLTYNPGLTIDSPKPLHSATEVADCVTGGQRSRR